MKTDEDLLREALRVAGQSYKNGNLPFGCILADANGTIIEEGENTVNTESNAIAHCEINLVNKLKGKYSAEFLATCTVYASTEPCPMCAAAIYWCGIGRLVFAIGKEKFHAIANTMDPAYKLDIAAKEILERGGRKVKVEQPMLEEEAIRFYNKIFNTNN
jgi:tRNA(Arg) A34 adenosine deaminase TadA